METVISGIWHSRKNRMDVLFASNGFGYFNLNRIGNCFIRKIAGVKIKSFWRRFKIAMEVLRDLNIEELAGMYSIIWVEDKKTCFHCSDSSQKSQNYFIGWADQFSWFTKQLELCFVKKIGKRKGIDIIAILHDVNLAARYADYIVILTEEGKLYDAGSANKVICEKC